MKIRQNDTIAAISTPLATGGGIGIVRVSGEDAFNIADKIFKSSRGEKVSSFESHTINYGHIVSPRTKNILDEVLLSVMRAPNSYTVEHVVEINCHGGIIALKKVLELCLSQGARLAEPGEFTKRAFLNGRIDLAQAEAVLDIITAETDLLQKSALEQLNGVFSKKTQALRCRIIDTLSTIELAIDFSQEDVKFEENEKITEHVNDIAGQIKNLALEAEKGMIVRHGANVVICGRPNVGKSSLMNALLKNDRVIVTPIAGTTRDVIEESIEIDGIKIRISDTAGIIETKDRVEIEGIRRSKEKLRSADIVILVLDYNRSLSAQDKKIYDTVKDKKVIIVVNKIDLGRKLNIREMEKQFGKNKFLKVSVLENKGLNTVESAVISALFNEEAGLPRLNNVVNLRHKQILKKTALVMERAVSFTGKQYNAELLACDLNEALTELGFITGETAGEEILDRIFSRFCVGK
ncbi:MAG: tRNA uridine-5-carboxymethylaminomethyl(34) synthesis GTPase MnmE [Candidatus Omnitrophota bacterium]